MARAYPGGDGRGHRRTLAKNGLRLPYHERIRLKKIAQRRKKSVGEMTEVKLGTLIVGSMTSRGHELVDLMERIKVKAICLQETKWKGSKTRELGIGYKLFYVGEDGRRNGVGIVLDDELKKGVVDVRRPSHRIIWLKVEIGEIIVS
ncbi:uncharacterized protein LOC125048336 [Penaeus chinensis]|uniref:uncharacterized protein LOC125048336 n=1 Tax=Penaeus chinensis TaxID=139456 RepID=UPI001FB5BA33|nr:uncharacterized protein LOC125048336 [Penaeus chinensis]